MTLPLISARFRNNPRMKGADFLPLQQGDPNLDRATVAAIQQALIDLGFPMPITTRNGKAPPDGGFGNETTQTVKAFQRDQTPPLTDDGAIGKDTMTALDAAINQLDGPGTTTSFTVVPFTVNQLILDAGGCGASTATDLLSGDHPTIVDPRAKANVVSARDMLAIPIVGETLVVAELDTPFRLTGSDAMAVIQNFHVGTGAPLANPDGSPVSNEMKLSTAFNSFISAIEGSITSQLSKSAVPGGVVDYKSITVSDPGLNFPNPASSFAGLALIVSNPLTPPVQFADAEMFILVGGTQGRKVTITNFSVTPGTRNYSADLLVQICDHFGVDEVDLIKSPPVGSKTITIRPPIPFAPPITKTITIPHPLACFWVLQHEVSRGRGTNQVAFVMNIEAIVTITDTF